MTTMNNIKSKQHHVVQAEEGGHDVVATVILTFQGQELWIKLQGSLYGLSHDKRNFFFVAQAVQKLYSGNGPFSHILCSFLQAIRQYIDRPERSRRNKMFQILVQGCRSSHT